MVACPGFYVIHVDRLNLFNIPLNQSLLLLAFTKAANDENHKPNNHHRKKYPNAHPNFEYFSNGSAARCYKKNWKE